MKRVIAFFMVVFIFLAIVGCSSSESEPMSEKEKRGLACLLVEKEVRGMLKSPSTAKFNPYSTDNATSLGNGVYEVVGYVDAQNSFGAMIRTNFIAKIKIEFNDAGNDYKSYKLLEFTKW